MDIQEIVSSVTNAEGNQTKKFFQILIILQFLPISEEITLTPEPVDGIMCVVKPVEVTEEHLQSNPGGQQWGLFRQQQVLGGLQELQGELLREHPKTKSGYE